MRAAGLISFLQAIHKFSDSGDKSIIIKRILTKSIGVVTCKHQV
jgi:hypothetical protein